jgi:hypothetical protein
LANNNCQCYLYNLSIENTLRANEQIIYRTFDFVSESDVILYWPLNNTLKPQIQNEFYINPNKDFSFNSDSQLEFTTASSLVPPISSYLSL